MRKMLLLSIWLFSVTRCDHPKKQVSGQEGGLVHIYCPYDSGYETYPKYFYKGSYSHRKTVIKTSDKMCKQRIEKRKYDLCDDTKKRILHVTIYDLDMSDNGLYWCEIDAYGFDPKIEVELKVHKAPAPVKPQLVTLNPPISTTVEAITINQQQSARTTVTVNSSVTAVWFTTSEDEHTGHNLFLTAVKTLLFVCLFTLCLLLAVKHWRSGPRQNRETSSIYETVTPGVRTERELRWDCSAPDCPDLSVSSTPPPDLCSHFTTKQRESTVSLGTGEYADVDVSGSICQYQQLDLSRLEEHVYDSLHGNNRPKDGPLAVKERTNC